MKTSIDTVSISGTLDAKLRVIDRLAAQARHKPQFLD
jgi:hypothetical protein